MKSWLSFIEEICNEHCKNGKSVIMHRRFDLRHTKYGWILHCAWKALYIYISEYIYTFEESERDWERSRDIKIMSTKESLREREMER